MNNDEWEVLNCTRVDEWWEEYKKGAMIIQKEELNKDLLETDMQIKELKNE